ncbi:uncharacterized protein BDW43DRAFT_263821 [Aspergillus alliaceus]|uniref:uncharacterized protein n=1 Tax=Petromyces alliaceus TaxID=209559 RepID=UPI0012A6C4EA|nr:uncharacterized protein BDW43DRAFT_263821 [Aspergillus alliaceus]KAB8237630.1 hypothetical protein BDW43DRAFT_263821 [Aspergillus alliaceus]
MELTIIWPASGDRGFDTDRPISWPGQNPRQDFSYSFSSSLRRVKLNFTKLAASVAQRCRGTPHIDNYTISWSQTEVPYAMGFAVSPHCCGTV